MSNILAFLLICMPLRMLAVYLAYKNKYLKLIGALYILFALGMTTVYLFGLRDTGAETGGKKIWWDNYRPLFALIWLLFGIAAVSNRKDAWKILSFDIVFGYLLFINQHYIKL